MNTHEFLIRILPPVGVFYLALIKDGKTAHKPFTSMQTMANAVAAYDASPDVSVYHACASYIDPFIESGGKRKYRVPENQQAAKCFWVDMDCGEDKALKGKGYLTQLDAVRALVGFCRTLGLSEPMLVSSGYGVHAYWTLPEEITPVRWIKIAENLKAALKFQKVLVDVGITADFARILRPIGSHNKKLGEDKVVKLLRDAPDTNPDDFERILSEFVSDHDINIDTPSYDLSLNSDMTGHLQPSIPTWADGVADRCAQVALMRDTKGCVNYEHWRGVIGVIKHCVEGEAIAHTWSEGFAGYSESETTDKFNSWNSPPTSCGFFELHNPGGCDGCEFKAAGKFKSPIILGRREEVQAEQVAEVVKDGAVITATIPAPPLGYIERGGTLYRILKDPEGILHEFAITQTLFYPRTRIKKADRKYALSMRAHLPREGVQDFEIDQVCLASPMELQKSLAEYQIMTTNNKDAGLHLSAYMKDWVEKLKHETDEQNTYTSFGWHDDGKNFLIGDRMYCPDGTVREVLVGSNARSKLADFPAPRGDLQEYGAALQLMYGAPGQEYRQYAVASGFGCVLTPLSTDPLYRGLVFALVGGDTAKGKTTLARAVLTAYGSAEAMSIKTDQGATVNARYARMGTYRNLPLLLDELTNVDVDALSAFCYTVSLGEEKERLSVGKAHGIGFADSNRWAMSPFVTANIDLHSALASKNGNTQAEAVRLIQVRVDQHAMTDMLSSEVNDAVRKMERNQGVAGDALVKYIVANRKAVEAMMVKWATRIEQATPDAKFRFYRGHAECSLTAIEVSNKLGITDFNLEALFAYVVRLFAELAETVATQNTLTAEDALSSMITTLSPRFIVSEEYRNTRDKAPENLHRMIEDPAGRYIIGNARETKLAGRLYLSKQAIRQWCATNRTAVVAVMDEITRLGLMLPIDSVEDKFYLGRGTSQATGQTRCICIDFKKLQSLYATEDAPISHLASHLKSVGPK